jgi:hypothetical protein
MFHVKHFGAIGGLRKSPRARPGGIQSWDLGLARYRDRT